MQIFWVVSHSICSEVLCFQTNAALILIAELLWHYSETVLEKVPVSEKPGRVISIVLSMLFCKKKDEFGPMIHKGNLLPPIKDLIL